MRTILSFLSTVLFVAACTNSPVAPTQVEKSPTSVVSSINLYDPTAPAPQLFSAVRVAKSNLFDTIELTFTDTAIDETLISAYFTGGADFAATQNIAPATEIGTTRTVTVIVPTGYTTVKLRYLWNPTPTIQSSETWGPFSNTVSVVDSDVIVVLKRRK